jgi:hypothetical protein
MPLRNPLELFDRNFGAKLLASAPLKNSQAVSTSKARMQKTPLSRRLPQHHSAVPLRSSLVGDLPFGGSGFDERRVRLYSSAISRSLSRTAVSETWAVRRFAAWKRYWFFSDVRRWLVVIAGW